MRSQSGTRSHMALIPSVSKRPMSQANQNSSSVLKLISIFEPMKTKSHSSFCLPMRLWLQCLDLNLLDLVFQFWVLSDVVEQPLKNKESKAGWNHQHYIAFCEVEFSIFFESHQIPLSVMGFGEDQVDVVQTSQFIDYPRAPWISPWATSGEMSSE